MKPLFLLTLCFFANSFIRAQDQLFKLDNSKLLVKVMEVGPDEIKYKLFDNLTGPQYVLKRSDVAMIIYENGSHEVLIKNASPTIGFETSESMPSRKEIRQKDSAELYKYSRNVAINFLNFMNGEIGFVFQREFFKSNFNLIIPFSFGIGKPTITQSVYYRNDNYYYNGGIYSALELNRKLYEIGLGINYYPSLHGAVNYYIGPVFKYMQYDATQTYNTSFNGGNNPFQISNPTNLNRYAFSISNGIIIRTKSRITMNAFISLGYKHDEVTSKIIDPISKKEVDPVTNPNEFFFWSGLMVGLSF